MSSSAEASSVGQTLVFVHGYLGGSRQWENQIDYFSDYFHVLTPGLPGFGDRNSVTAPESVAGFASEVLEQVDKLHGGTFHLVGHSMGGMIVQEMVAQAPDLIDRLVLYGTGANGMMPGRFETIEESRSKVTGQGVELTARNIAASWFLNGESAEGYALCFQLACEATLQAALAGLTAMENWSGVSALGNIKSPTLILWGDKDRAYLWNQPYQLWTGIKEAQLAVVPNCSHAVHSEKPYLFNPILLDFLLAGETGAVS